MNISKDPRKAHPKVTQKKVTIIFLRMSCVRSVTNYFSDPQDRESFFFKKFQN